MYSSMPTLLLAIKSFTGSKTKQLSLVDAALVSLSQKYTILTFDDALNRAIKKQVA
jgi:predicted nucleic acid-binding protein